MKKTPLAAALIASLIAHGVHYRNPDDVPPGDHLEGDHQRTPTPAGRPTAWVTSTSTAMPASTVAGLQRMLGRR
jgi:hypothetical protein